MTLDNKLEILDKYHEGHEGTLCSKVEYKLIIENLGFNMLVFGIGNDTDLWLKLNSEVVFIEHSGDWAKTYRNRADVIDYDYWTKMWDAKKILGGNHAKLYMDKLPSRVKDTHWGMIFVDAPTGYSTLRSRNCPGRFQSIYTASQMSADYIVVHDYDRRIEKTCCDLWLGKPDEIVGRMALFKR